MKKKVFVRRLALSSFASLVVVASPLSITGAGANEKVVQENSEITLREPETGFRVLPYLQSPTSTSMTISWVSELNEPGPSCNGSWDKSKKSNFYPTIHGFNGVYRKRIEQKLTYNAGNGVVETIPQGSWLESNSNYKHTVTIEGLQPNTKYQYRVKQGKKVHNSKFETSPDRENWDDLH